MHAVLDGFHLAPYQPDCVRETIAALKEIEPEFVIPLHCTGEIFYEIANAEMPARMCAHTRARAWYSARERDETSGRDRSRQPTISGRVAPNPRHHPLTFPMAEQI